MISSSIRQSKREAQAAQASGARPVSRKNRLQNNRPPSSKSKKRKGGNFGKDILSKSTAKQVKFDKKPDDHAALKMKGRGKMDSNAKLTLKSARRKGFGNPLSKNVKSGKK